VNTFVVSQQKTIFVGEQTKELVRLVKNVLQVVLSPLELIVVRLPVLENVVVDVRELVMRVLNVFKVRTEIGLA
jgi:hypothetical protein